MIRSGQVSLLRFPQTDSAEGKLRPVLILHRTPGDFDDFLVCMISSKLHHVIEGFDEVITDTDDDFSESGLKKSSVVRISRLAVVHCSLLLGSIGSISSERLIRILTNLSDWLQS